MRLKNCTYKKIEPLRDNTVCEAREVNGEIVSYLIRPAEGHKLHEKGLDMPAYDEEGKETGKIKCGYTTVFVTVGANYDWEANPRRIYAIPIDAKDEIIDAEVTDDSEMAEKAKAYDIITGVAE